MGGGFKINLSKSGVGYSFGGKGFRVTKAAKGKIRTTASIHGTGLSYSKEFAVNKRKSGVPNVFPTSPNTSKHRTVIDNNSNEMLFKTEERDKIMKKCPICEKIYNDYDQYCLKCNYKLQVIKDFKEEDYLSESSIPARASNIEKPFYKKGWFYIIVVAILLLAFRFGASEDTPNLTEADNNDNNTGGAEVASQSIMVDKESDNSVKQLNSDNPTYRVLYKKDSIIEVYAPIDNKKDGWKDECKKVFKMLKEEYEGYENIIFKIHNSTEKATDKQLNDSNIIALWQSNPYSYITESKPTITWYPNGAGPNAKQELEIWNP